jgi:hypothetical protein
MDEFDAASVSGLADVSNFPLKIDDNPLRAMVESGELTLARSSDQ